MSSKNNKKYKGIILAGGHGTRLYPATNAISKQLIPIYDKPMVYYPLSTLLSAEIKDILLISSPDHIDLYKKLLKDGSQFGIKISYKVQDSPGGLAQAFLLGEKFIGDDNVCLILGDNIFHGINFKKKLINAKLDDDKATVFAYHVNNPQEFGVVSFDNLSNVVSIEEKPANPKSNYAVTGLYFYPNSVIDAAKKIKPSARGELEITDVNNYFLKKNLLKTQLLGRNFAWLDTGTHESLLEAGQFVNILQKRQGLQVGCPEEAAYINKWISKDYLIKIANKNLKNEYGKYLLKLINNEDN